MLIKNDRVSGAIVGAVIATWSWLLLTPPGQATPHAHVTSTTSEVAAVIKHPAQHHMPPPELMKWDTRSTDKLASWPGSSDPMWHEQFSTQLTFACIRWTESRNHRTVVEPHSGAAGWYQIMPYEWWYARKHIAGLPASAARATGDQQSAVALWYYHRNHGFLPEWTDHCNSRSVA